MIEAPLTRKGGARNWLGFALPSSRMALKTSSSRQQLPCQHGWAPALGLPLPSSAAFLLVTITWEESHAVGAPVGHAPAECSRVLGVLTLAGGPDGQHGSAAAVEDSAPHLQAAAGLLPHLPHLHRKVRVPHPLVNCSRSAGQRMPVGAGLRAQQHGAAELAGDGVPEAGAPHRQGPRQALHAVGATGKGGTLGGGAVEQQNL
mmetsp:Transcript_698/g.2099  ORF Transcript_698/g.2099 Transcript_698/m.2099 type:complete len:203 (-) Transcript_698:295-903(-)